MKTTDITSHEIACGVLGKDSKESTNIHDQLDDIADALNKADEDFKADFSNPEQRKWRPFFVVDNTGFRFSLSYYVTSHSSTYVGSRLCQYFRSQETADFFGTKFEDLHKRCFYRKNKPVSDYRSITSHEIACEVLGKDPKESASIHDQLDDIAKAINKVDGNYKSDYSNNEPKWYPWFDAAAGFRFSRSVCDISFSGTNVGSRLCQRFRTEQVSDFFGKQFESLHIKSFNA